MGIDVQSPLPAGFALRYTAYVSCALAAPIILDLCYRVNFSDYRGLGLSIDIGRRDHRRSLMDFAIWQWSKLNVAEVVNLRGTIV